MKYLRNFLLFGALLAFSLTFSQGETPNPFDFGKMWTFENPPKEWFKEAYQFEPSDEWYDSVRKSSLRFASWCSASFVSPDGLIMTNHHCARIAITDSQMEGENFDANGFYAPTMADERKTEGLFVEQMVQVADITEEVMALVSNPANEMDQSQQIEVALKKVQEAYSQKAGWEGLRLQTVSFYSGVRFSIYGYKRYDDIRLVFYPELDLGLYGGDPDNFTYPRYNLDVSFYRAYDENGQPLDTSDNYLVFNPDGVSEGEPTFVVGNPGRTERYRTVAQLEYDRDYRYPMSLRYLHNRHDLLMEEYAELSKDPSKDLEAQKKNQEAFRLSNSIKSTEGILRGLKDAELFGRKVEMENYIRSKNPGLDHWDKMKAEYDLLIPHTWAINHLNPSPLRGEVLTAMHGLYSFENSIEEEISEEDLEKGRQDILELLTGMDTPRQRKLFRLLMGELQADVYPGNDAVERVLQGRSADQFVDELFESTVFTDQKKATRLLEKPKKLAKSDDILLHAARILIPQFYDAALAYSASSPKREQLGTLIAQVTFDVFGSSLPPDATFTLRLADGVVKGFDYNGTQAPYKTTYFGLYDRHYSNDGEFPWSLPERWKNPPVELLKAPINFVTTNDIIGGNSGSPMINKNREAIGLIFDSNIQSLPSRFIFDEKDGRTVSVHAGGIHAALKYIYKADRIIEELEGE